MLLETKLFVPPLRSTSVPRAQARARLERSAGGDVALIVAPAGYGKTTAAVDALSNSPGPCAWLQLDTHDADPWVFFLGVARTLARINPAFSRRAIERLSDDHVGDPKLVADLLLADLTANGLPSEPPITLVLDDYHCVANERLDAVVAWWLERLPSSLRVWIIARAAPELSCARLRAQGRLHELSTSELAFSLAETESVVRAADVSLSEQALQHLWERTEGWAAALRMAVLSLSRGESSVRLFSSLHGGNRDIADYLLGETLSAESPEICEFLLRSSVLSRMCGALCDVMIGREQSGELLESLEKRGLFLVPLDRERRWYRYHDLFRELLSVRLEQTHSAETITEQRVRAARWLEEQGHLQEALDHYVALHRWLEASELIERAVPTWSRSGRLDDLSRWLERIPDLEHRKRPRLLVLSAFMLQDEQRLTLAPRLIERAEHLLELAAQEDAGVPGEKHRELGLGTAAARDQILAEIAMMRSFLARMQLDFEASTRLSRFAAQHANDSGLPIRARSLTGIGQDLYMRGETRESAEALSVALSEALLERDFLSLFMALGYLAEVRLLCGEPDKAVRAVRQVGRFIEGLEVRTPKFLLWQRSALLAIFLERGQLERAKEVFAPMSELTYGAPMMAFVVHMRRAQLARLGRDFAAARQALSAVQELFERSGTLYTWGFPSATAQLAELSWLEGDHERARVYLAHEARAPESNTFLAEAESLLYARIDADLGDGARALEVVRRTRPEAESKGRVTRVVMCDLIEAIVQHRSGDTRRAREHFARALHVASQRGLVRAVLDAGPRVEALLRDHAQRAAEGSWASHLLGMAQQEVKGHVPVMGVSEELSLRELEVLSGIARAQSNAQIAAELRIAEATVKVHARNLYQKLGVRTRAQALLKARELGIVAREL